MRKNFEISDFLGRKFELPQNRKKFQKRNMGGRSNGRIHRGSTSRVGGHGGRRKRVMGRSSHSGDSSTSLDSGIQPLINRGIIPPNYDLTHVLSSFPSPITTAPVRIYESKEKSLYDKQQIMTANMNEGVFHDVKYDLVSFPAENVRREAVPLRKVKVVNVKPTGLGPIKKKVVRGKRKKTKGVSQPRQYDQLMDAYSRHRIIIRRGKVVENDEFLSFQRVHRSIWGPIVTCLRELEHELVDIPLVKLSGDQLANLARSTLGVPKRSELLRCIENTAEIRKKMIVAAPHGPVGGIGAGLGASGIGILSSSSKRFVGEKGREEAARIIQKTWKMVLCRRNYAKKRGELSATLALSRSRSSASSSKSSSRRSRSPPKAKPKTVKRTSSKEHPEEGSNSKGGEKVNKKGVYNK